MHRWLLQGEIRRWYLEDVGLPLAASLIVVGLWRWLLPENISPIQTFFVLSIITLTSLGASILAAPIIRRWVAEQYLLRLKNS